MRFDALIIRLAFILLLALAGYLLNPLEKTTLLEGFDPMQRKIASAVLGTVISSFIILFEIRVRHASIKTLIGAAAGSILGLIGAFLLGLLIILQETTALAGEMKLFLTLAMAFFMGYVGLMVGAAKGEYIDLSALGGVFADKTGKRDYKILDTSVIIDGRIADVAETGFLGGTLIIPQFILRELQQVADSPDSSKRQRGRRGQIRLHVGIGNRPKLGGKLRNALRFSGYCERNTGGLL